MHGVQQLRDLTFGCCKDREVASDSVVQVRGLFCELAGGRVVGVISPWCWAGRGGGGGGGAGAEGVCGCVGM